MTIITALKKKLKATKNDEDLIAGRPLGDTTDCSPRNHRHSDKYHNKCHDIKLKHRKKGEKPHPKHKMNQKSPVKQMSVQESN